MINTILYIAVCIKDMLELMLVCNKTRKTRPEQHIIHDDSNECLTHDLLSDKDRLWIELNKYSETRSV